MFEKMQLKYIFNSSQRIEDGFDGQGHPHCEVHLLPVRGQDHTPQPQPSQGYIQILELI